MKTILKMFDVPINHLLSLFLRLSSFLFLHGTYAVYSENGSSFNI